MHGEIGRVGRPLGKGKAQSDMLYEKVFNNFFLSFNFSTLYIDRNIRDF